MTTDAAEHREPSPPWPGWVASHTSQTRRARAQRAFRQWRHTRPFWGGLIVLLAGAEYYFSGHFSFSPVVVHLGPQGFLSYVIPLMLLLCGVLLWLTPAQHIFYGVIAAATAVYGLIGLNLGGFLLGMVLGMIGGALGASWTQVRPPAAIFATAPPAGDIPNDPLAWQQPEVESPAEEEPLIPFEVEPSARELPAPTGVEPDGTAREDQLRDPAPLAGPSQELGNPGQALDEPIDRTLDESTGTPLDEPSGTALDESSRARDESAEALGGPGDAPTVAQRGSSPLTDTLPTSRVSPLHQQPAAEPATEAHPDTEGQPSAEGQPDTEAQPATEPGPPAEIESPAEPGSSAEIGAGPGHPGSDDAQPPTGGGLPRRSPRVTGLSVIALTVLAVGALVAVRQVPASAAPCAGRPTPSPSKTSTPTPTPTPTASASAGDPVGDLLGGLLGGVGKLLGGTAPTPTATPTSGAGADAARPAVAPGPTPTCSTGGKPAPGKPRPGGGSPTVGGKPTGGSRPGSTPGRGAGSPTAKPTASASPPPLRRLAISADQPPVSIKPGRITTARLTMTNLVFVGMADVPLASGDSVRAMQFSMDTAVQTPFELDFPVPGDQTGAEVSDQLTLTGHVSFFTTSLKGDLGPVPLSLPQDIALFVPGLPLPLVTLTDVTIELVYVHTDTLIGDNLHGLNKS